MQSHRSFPVIVGALFAAAILATTAVAQEPNLPTDKMTFNGIDEGSYPIAASVATPSALSIELVGSPSAAGQPFILAQSTSVLPVGIPVGSQFIDINPATLTFVFDGTSPTTSLFNLFARLNAQSEVQLNLPTIGAQASVFFVGAYQSVILDPGAPMGFTLTAATSLTLLPPPSFGTLHYSRGLATANHAAFSLSQPASPTSNPTMPPSFAIESTGLSGFQQYASSVNPWWQKDFASLPAHVTAMAVNESVAFPYVKTMFGDLYQYTDKSTNTRAYLLAGPTGPVPLAATTTPPAGASASPFEFEVGVDANRLAYVVDPAAPASDSLILASLDGPTLAGGASVVDVTPVSPVVLGIAEESLTFLTNTLLFVGSPTSTTAPTGLLFQAPRDGSAVGVEVSLPPVAATSMIPTLADAEIRYSDDRTMAVVQAGDTATSEDLYLVQDFGPGTLFVTNLTQFVTATEVEEFGDASDGFDNQVAISPLNTRVAFVTVESASDELYIVNTNNPGVLTHVTNGTNFDALVDNVIELHWADENRLIFWAGDTTNTTDLYVYDVPSGMLTNLTGTNLTATIPFPGAGNVDPAEMFYSINRSHLFWARDGSDDGMGNPTRNIIALDLTTLTLTDITGNEFSGGTGPAIDSGGTGSHMQYAKNSDMIVFFAEEATGTDDHVFAFDAGTLSPAIRLTAITNIGGTTIDNLSINDAGTMVAFGDNLSGQDQVYLANTMVGDSAVSIFAPPPAVTGGDLSDGSIIWTGANQFVFVYGTNSSTNPTDARLYLHDSVLGTLTIDSTVGSYWMY